MIQTSVREYTLDFRFAAGTSRGILRQKVSWYITLTNGQRTGTGECSIIPGLSPDDPSELPDKLKEICRLLESGVKPQNIDLMHFPAIRFALECALVNIQTGQSGLLYPSFFTTGEQGIPINGLIWMGTPREMINQIEEKVAAGFRCLKLKVGTLSFDDELSLLKEVRQRWPNIELRLDANGAFKPDDALRKLDVLSGYKIHSIEQPIRPGQWAVMEKVCRNSPIPVALDEELIGISDRLAKDDMLATLSPAYIILKPSLLGGFAAAEEWIALAEARNIDWWTTSALESNIGLNAIAQWAFTQKSSKVQGLGTGQLFRNNIPSPLYIRDAALWYDREGTWDFSSIND